MNNSIHFAGKLGLIAALTGALAGCVTHVHNSPEVVYVPAPPAYTPPPEPAPAPAPVVVQPAPVVIQAPAPIVIQAPEPVVEIPAVIYSEADFQAPLSPYGDWVMVQGYGRVWRPRHVDGSWRPYADGRWEWTEAGWYWVSEEPWGWATYHYGRWDWTREYGWIWAPQTQWAPAWVTWREGAGYIGWAPLPPTARFSMNGALEIHGAIAPERFCFVETPHLLHPIRPATVIVNNTIIVNKTVNVTKVKVVNKVVINEGPGTDNIERATGQRLQRNSISEVRQRDEDEARARRDSDHVTSQVHTPNRYDSPPRTDREVEPRAIRPANPATPGVAPQIVVARPVVAAPPVVVAQPQAPEPVRTIPTRPERQAPQHGKVKPEKAESPVALNNTPAPQPTVEPPPVRQTPPRFDRQLPTEPEDLRTNRDPRATMTTPSQIKAGQPPQTGHGQAKTEFKSPKEDSSKKDKEKANDKGRDKNQDKNQGKQQERD
jgi:hypothetical protein